MEDEFVLDFAGEGSMTPIDIVAYITGLSYEEIRSCSEILIIDSHIPANKKGGDR